MAMRYRKGFISINDLRDIPMLLLIRDSRAISLEQLYAVLPLLNIEANRNTTYWRIRRLEENGYVEQLKESRTVGCPVYAITHQGLGLLESRGHCLLALGSFSRTIVEDAEVLHMIALTAIRLSLLRSKKLILWKNELQVVSENLAVYGQATKDYDAHVTVRTSAGPRSFGLEYERTAKSAGRYQEIRDMIDADPRTSFVLYLSPSQELNFLLSQELAGTRAQIALGLLSQFHNEHLQMRVVVPEKHRNSWKVLEEMLIAKAMPGDASGDSAAQLSA
jgi:hypothetical protein